MVFFALHKIFSLNTSGAINSANVRSSWSWRCLFSSLFRSSTASQAHFTQKKPISSRIKYFATVRGNRPNLIDNTSYAIEKVKTLSAGPLKTIFAMTFPRTYTKLASTKTCSFKANPYINGGLKEILNKPVSQNTIVLTRMNSLKRLRKDISPSKKKVDYEYDLWYEEANIDWRGHLHALLPEY